MKEIDRFDRLSRLATPIVSGLLIAFIAFMGNRTITTYTSRQENARLITQLQIQREQAESDLRRDVFDQAIGALLSEKELGSGSDVSLSKRLLKLELLAHNFGDSLSLAPLFVEFDLDLENLENAAGRNIDERIRISALRDRLRSLAKRLASQQLSSLEQHGMVFDIRTRLEPGGNKYVGRSVEFSWPLDTATQRLGAPGDYPAELQAEITKLLDDEIRRLGVMSFDSIERQYRVVLGDLDPGRRTVSVTLEICWEDDEAARGKCPRDDPQISRPFTLDHFNFPKIDNTRLSDNQRFAVVLEDYETMGDNPEIVIAAVIFPSEHSSLRDRPSMEEAVELLNSVLESQNPDNAVNKRKQQDDK
jgi:DNA-binding transcriptional ArsR family regulator